MNKKGLLFTFFWLISLLAIGQEKSYPLAQILAKIEVNFKVTFSYADENIRNVAIGRPSEDFSLQETLIFLRQQTGLVFERLNDSFISVSKPREALLNVCGILIDAETSEPIIGATIQAAHKYQISDSEGNFQFDSLQPNDQVMIRSLGYNAQTLLAANLSDTPCQTILLEVQPLTLKEIVVDNYLTKGIDKRINGSFSVSIPDLGILPGLIEPDVLQTIQALPGIQSINETVSDINVRGGTNDQNLVLWDGIKMYQTGHFFGLISAYNPYLADRVTLIKNGTTAALGDGVSSTIDIRSEDGLAKNLEIGGGINLINTDLYAKVPVNRKLSLQFSTRHSFAGFLETPTYDQYFDRAFRDTDVFQDLTSGNDSRITANKNFNFHDFSGRVLYNITPRDKLRINFLNVSNDIEYEENAQINNIIESRTSGLEQKNLASGISYDRLWSDRFSTSAQVYLSRYQLLAVNYDIFNDQRLTQENEVLDTGLKLDAQLSLGNRINLLSGYQFFEIGVRNLEDVNNPRFRRNIKRVVRSHALLGELEYTSPAGDTYVRAGIRGNYYAKFEKFIPEPRLVVNQKLAESLTLEILGEFKNQATTQTIDFQNDFLGIENRRWVLSNGEDIPLIESKQFSTGLHYHKANLLISLEGYYRQVDGIISSSQGFQNQFQFIRSAGSYETVGLDFLVNNRFDRLSSWVSYSIMDNTFNFPEFTPSEFPADLDIRHSLTIGTSYASNEWQLSAGLNWRTGKPYTAADSVIDNRIDYQSPNSSRLKNYLRLDLSAKYNFKLHKKAKGQIGFALWNVLDRRNVVNTYYTDLNNEAVAVDQFALGITPNVSFRINFVY